MLCATIANFSQMEAKERGKKKYWVPSDFVPDTINPPKPKVVKKQTPEEMAEVLKTIATSRTNKRKRKE